MAIKTVNVQPVAVIVSTNFGDSPHPYLCSICLNKVITSVSYKAGTCTWFSCTGIAFLGGILGCCVIPFFVDTCKDAHHSCPVCCTPLAITVQPIAIIFETDFSDIPQSHLCSICLNKVTTNVTYKTGTCTWLSCTGIAFLGGILGCCVIPFLVDAFKDAHHSCPVCSTSLGVHKRICGK